MKQRKTCGAVTHRETPQGCIGMAWPLGVSKRCHGANGGQGWRPRHLCLQLRNVSCGPGSQGSKILWRKKTVRKWV